MWIGPGGERFEGMARGRRPIGRAPGWPAPRGGDLATRSSFAARPRTMGWVLLNVGLLVLSAALLSGGTVQGGPHGPSALLPRTEPLRDAPSVTHGATPLWTNLSATQGYGPSLRCCSAMAFDAMTGSMVLFGGSGPCGPCNDTWVDQNGSWQNLTAQLATSPSGRSWEALAYDPLLGGELMFGGLQSGAGPPAPLGDTWEFSHGRWKQLSPLQSPSARWATGMAFDPQLSAMVLYGGFDPSGGFHSGSWMFRNGSWSPIPTLTSPGPRWAPGLTFDAAQQELLLFGGLGADGSVLNDTWGLQDSQWVEQAPANSPPARERGDLTFDPSLNASVLFGGDVCTTACGSSVARYLSDTWMFQGGSWTNLTSLVGPGPSARCCSSMVYDPLTATLLLETGAEAGGFSSTTTWGLSLPTGGALALTSVQPMPSIVPLGSPAIFAPGVEGNLGAVEFEFLHLPLPCLPSSRAVMACAPGAVGTYAVEVEVRDASGSLATAVAYLTVVAVRGNASAPLGPAPPTSAAAIGALTGSALVVAALLVYGRSVRRRSLGDRMSRSDGPPRVPSEGSRPSSSSHSSEKR